MGGRSIECLLWVEPRCAQLSPVNRLTLTGSFLPLVRREGIWTGFFFFHSAQVMGPSGVWMTSSSMGTLSPQPLDRLGERDVELAHVRGQQRHRQRMAIARR